MKREFNPKAVILYLLICVLTLTFLGKLFYLQIAKGNYYNELSKYRSLRIIDIEPIRGRILDRNGVVLAENIPSFDLVLIPEDIRDKEEEFKKISNIIRITPEEIEEIIKKANLPSYQEVLIKKGLTDAERIKIEELHSELAGFNVKVSTKRFYPYGDIGECFLGYVGPVTEEDLKSDNFYGYNDYIGKQGIEYYYESYLRGEKGKKEVLLDSLGRVQRIYFEQPAKPGSDVYLTIDINVQKKLEEIIGINKGVSILTNNYGEIIAMVSHPSFDPNLFVRGISEQQYQKYLEENAFLNRAIQASYPPGSTFKPVTLISSLETGSITPETVINCGSYLKIGNRIFKEWAYPGSFGSQTPAIALANSSDVFFWQIGIKTGIENIASYARLLNLEKVTGIDIPFEITGNIPDSTWKEKTYGEKWYIGDTANACIGQGFVLVTPIAMSTLYQSFSNKGVAYKPHFLLKIVSSEGNVIKTFSKEILFQYNLRDETFQTLIEGLKGLANKPDMKIMRVNNLEVYAKTGTAEIGDGSVHHWLISILEEGTEKYIGLLFFEKSSFPSSHSLAPLMKEVFQSIIE